MKKASIAEASFPLWPVVLLGIAGSAVFNLAPLYLADAGHRLTLNDQQIGQLMGVEILGIAIASIAALILTSYIRPTTIAITGLLVLVAGNIGSLFVTDFIGFSVSRFLVGLLGAGMVYVSAILIIARHHRKVFGYALLSFSNMVTTAVLLWVLPLLSDYMDHNGTQLVIAIMGTIALVCAPQLPWNLSVKSDNKINLGNSSFVSLLGLLGLAAYAMNLGAVWTYAERILLEVNPDPELTARVLSLSIVFQALGSLSAMMLSGKIQAATIFKIVLAIQLFTMLLLAHANSLIWLIAGFGLWGASWNLGVPFILGLLANIPGNSRHMVLVPGTEALGVASGPLLASIVINDGVRNVVPSLGFLTMLIAMVILYWLTRAVPASSEEESKIDVSQRH